MLMMYSFTLTTERFVTNGRVFWKGCGVMIWGQISGPGSELRIRMDEVEGGTSLTSLLRRMNFKRVALDIS